MTQTSQLPALYRNPRPITTEQDADKSLRPAENFGFAAKTNSVPALAMEFPLLCKYYPILFAADSVVPTPVTLLGLRDAENLYCDATGTWEPDTFVPAYIRRYPFIFLDNTAQSEFILCIDEASEMLVADDSNKLFAEGKPTPVLERALEFCREFQANHVATMEFAKALAEQDLLVDNRADVTLTNGTKLSLDGFKIIDEAKFNELPSEVFLEWRARGWLHLVYCHLISLGNFGELVNRVAKR
jgi:hypothetical protein